MSPHLAATVLALILAMPELASAARHVPGEHRAGRSARSAQVRYQFKKHNPCPVTGTSAGACAGYVIDHVIAIKRGGIDQASNMQWQTRAAAKEKDKWE